MQFKKCENCIHNQVCMVEAVIEGEDAILNLDQDDLLECRHFKEDVI